jgi:hypothetical protein
MITRSRVFFVYYTVRECDRKTQLVAGPYDVDEAIEKRRELAKCAGVTAAYVEERESAS